MDRTGLFRAVIFFSWALALAVVVALFVSDYAEFTQTKISQRVLLAEKADRLTQIEADAVALGGRIASEQADMKTLDRSDSDVLGIEVRAFDVRGDVRYQFKPPHFPLTAAKVDEMADDLDKLRSVLNDLILQKRNLVKIDDEISAMMDRLDEINRFAKMRAQLQDRFGYLDALRSWGIQDQLINAYQDRRNDIVQLIRNDGGQVKSADSLFQAAHADASALLAREGSISYWAYLKGKLRRFSLVREIKSLVK
jgi:hypothetical protein